MEFNPEMVTMVINGVFLFFIIMGFLFGLKRGHRISFLRFIFISAIALTMYISAPVISRTILEADVSGIVGNVTIEVGGEPHEFTSLNNLMQSVIQSNEGLQGFVDQNPSFQSLIEQLPTIVTNIIIFILGFWLLKILTWPIFAIIAIARFKRDKDGVKYKKKRLIGGGIGIVQGFIIAFVTFIPIAGISSILNTEGMVGGESTILGSYIAEDISKYFPVYQNSALGIIGGLGDMDGRVFDGLTTLRVTNDQTGKTTKIRPRQEAIKTINIIDSIDKLIQMYRDIENEERDDIDWVLMEKLVDDIFRLDSLKLVVEDYLPTIVDDLMSDEELDVVASILDMPAGEDIDNFVKDFVADLDQNTLDNYKSDVMMFIEIGKALDNYGIVDLLFSIIREDEVVKKDLAEQALNIFAENPGLMDDITQAALSSHSVTTYLPQGLNIFIGLMEEIINEDRFEVDKIEIDRIDSEQIDWVQEAEIFATAFHNIAVFVNNVDPFNIDSNTEIVDVLKKLEFTVLGASLDALIETELLAGIYISLTEAVISTDEIQDLDKYIDFDLLINTLQTISWEQEFLMIDNAMSIYIDFEESEAVNATTIQGFVEDLRDSQLIDIAIDGILNVFFTDVFEEEEVPLWAESFNIDPIADNAEFVGFIAETIYKYLNFESNETSDILIELRDVDIDSFVDHIESINDKTDPAYLNEFKEFFNNLIIFSLEKADVDNAWVSEVNVDDFIDNAQFLADMFKFGVDFVEDDVLDYEQEDIKSLGVTISSLNDMSAGLNTILQGLYDDIIMDMDGLNEVLSHDFEFAYIDWSNEADWLEEMLAIYIEYQVDKTSSMASIEQAITKTANSYILDNLAPEIIGFLVDEEPMPVWVDEAEITWISNNAELFSEVVDIYIYIILEDGDPNSIDETRASDILVLIDNMPVTTPAEGEFKDFIEGYIKEMIDFEEPII